MKHAYNRPLCDHELRSHLDRGDTVIFTGLAHDWQEFEKQIERIGFGQSYAVSRATRLDRTSEQIHTRISPLRPVSGN